MSLKLVHAADLHLDSPLRGLERYEGAPHEELRGATRRALENLVDLCLREEAKLLLLAGDLYDGEWRDYNTGLFFVKQMARLAREGVRVVWIRGNHDAASQITGRLRLPEGVHELGCARPETLALDLDGVEVAVHGQGYARRDVSEDLAARYPKPRPGCLNVGLLHTALDGREGHDLYAPCSVDRLRNHGYDYWALGHVHAREVVCQEPWIVFPGNLQGRHARELGPKGATLVTLEDGRIARVEPRELDVVRWAVCDVDATGAASAEEVVDLARAALEDAAAGAGARTLAARVRVTGRSAAHAALAARREHWAQEIRAAAMASGAPIWVEKVALAIGRPVDLSLTPGDPIAELVASLHALRADRAALAELSKEFAVLARQLPAEYRERADALVPDQPEALARLLAELEPDLVTRLIEAREDA